MKVRVKLVALVALVTAAGASAAVPPAGSVGPTQPTVAWQGQPYAVSVSDPRFCAPQAVDPINLVCDHFTLAVEAPGTVTVAIEWPSAANDFDLYVCQLDPTADLTTDDACTGGREIARSDAQGSTSETATFTAPAAGVYEIRVVPFALASPSAYDGSATYSAPPTPPAGASCSPQTIRIVVPGIADICVGIGA